MMRLTLGKAEKKDFNRINELFEEMLQTIYDTDQVNGYEDGYLDKFFDGHEDWISIAIDDDKIVAFLSIEVHHEEDVDYIYLDDFSITKQYRNKGIGTKLISSAEVYANEINIHNIYLHVEKANTSALKFYERLEYGIYKEQKTRYLMNKSI